MTASFGDSHDLESPGEGFGSHSPLIGLLNLILHKKLKAILPLYY